MAAKTSTIPAFTPTALPEIDATVERLRATFRTNRTKDIQFRLVQLRKLYWGLVDNTALIKEGLAKDLGKSEYEAMISELDWSKTECMNQINNIEKWAKDEPVKNLPMQYWPMKPRMRKEPLGLVLLVGAYNYPYQLNLSAAIGAIGAGNVVVMKPSEGSPHSASMLKKIFDDNLDQDCYVCVNGALDEMKHLLNIKWDKILFTGGKVVGTIVAKKAAETLTPVILELGGLNPGFVTRNANLKIAARRLMFQKALNAGQTCLSANYILVERSVLSTFIGELNAIYKEFFPKGAKVSPDYGRIGGKRHFDRLMAMLNNTKGKIVLGGASDASELFIEPTVVLVNDIEDSMMAEESFGPLWSIMPYDNLDEAISIANKVDPTPLSLVTFGSDTDNEKVLHNVTSGGATCNDSFFHGQVPAAPMGGVGSSGTGNYHGYYSFQSFSHHRCITQVPNWAEKILKVRYMPYSMKNLEQMKAMVEPKPNFDRSGNVVKGLAYWVGLVLSLGGKSPQRSVSGSPNGTAH